MNNSLFTLVILSLLGILNNTNGANILGIWYHGGKSHHILGEMLFRELAKRGHNVTMVSPFPLSKPVANYTDIHLTGIVEDQTARERNFMDMNKGGLYVQVDTTVELCRAQLELTMNHTALHDLLKSGTKFDVIIMDWFLNSALLIFGKLFNAPVIPLASQGTTQLSQYVTGSPLPPSYVPVTTFPFTDRMTFAQRLINGVFSFVFHVVSELGALRSDRIVRKYFGDEAPGRKELRDLVALVFTNSHYSYETVRPSVPNSIPIGGFHIQPPKKLPKDLKDFMDGADKGVVYFSLGSNMKSALLPEEKQREILRALARIPYRVLWKWEKDDLPGKPDNVLIRKWLPQNDILAHPNLKLFISHGGLLSTIESLYHGVPVLGIPIFGDQESNIKTAELAGYAIHLALPDITEDTLLNALNEILNNKKYSDNAKTRSALLRDQPISPMDTAVFWVEHVIRHKGAPHLKNAGVDLPWYQYFLLDVIALVLVVLVLVVLVITQIVKCLFRANRLLFRKIKRE